MLLYVCDVGDKINSQELPNFVYVFLKLQIHKEYQLLVMWPYWWPYLELCDLADAILLMIPAGPDADTLEGVLRGLGETLPDKNSCKQK